MYYYCGSHIANGLKKENEKGNKAGRKTTNDNDVDIDDNKLTQIHSFQLKKIEPNIVVYIRSDEGNEIRTVAFIYLSVCRLKWEKEPLCQNVDATYTRLGSMQTVRFRTHRKNTHSNDGSIDEWRLFVHTTNEIRINFIYYTYHFIIIHIVG